MYIRNTERQVQNTRGTSMLEKRNCEINYYSNRFPPQGYKNLGRAVL